MWYNCRIISLMVPYTERRSNMRMLYKILFKLKTQMYILILNLLKEESYEEDFRRNFSVKYTGLLQFKKNYS